MSYKALYRVFRPKTFSEVVGQKHIVAVLKSQVTSGQISHAYLFTGSRGTGKTSIAKIFARSISCINSHDGEACLECQLCKETFNDTSMDVVEIDAASNNGVDEIRDLREKVKYAPVTGKYKVYIIDEVHMLSGGAFNALLKTLEEPPAHAVFILATTEPQKLPDTIISRCQRYDFERIDRDDIADRLEYICKQVNAVGDRDALLMIADFSKGGLRDAISLLDQCIVFGDGKVSVDAVLGLLGKSDDDTLFKITDMLIDKDSANLIAFVNSVIKKGTGVSLLTADIVDHLRTLMLFKTVNNPENIADVARINDYKAQSDRADIYMVLRGIKLLSAAMAEMKWAYSPIVNLEIALMEICSPAVDNDNLAIMQRLSELEKAVANIGTVKKQHERKVYQPIPEAEAGTKNENDSTIHGTSAAFDNDLPWEEDIPLPPEENVHEDNYGNFIMDEPEEDAKEELQSVNNEEDGAENSYATQEKMSEQASDKTYGGEDFRAEDYDDFMKEIKSVNKRVHISLSNSFFGGFENGVFTIGYPDESYDIFMRAVEASKEDVIKALGNMGFKDCKVCVKILKQDKTEDLKKMFGDDIKFID